MAKVLQRRRLRRAAAEGLAEVSELGARLGLVRPRRRNRMARVLAGAVPVAIAIMAAGAAASRRRSRDRADAPPRGRAAATGSSRRNASPAEHVAMDARADQAPDPRRHYPSPEDLREDIALDLASRRDLLSQWKDEVDREIEAGAEGMAFADDKASTAEAGLAGEARRVSKALAAIDREIAAV